MKVSELREMSSEEVQNRLEELHEEFFNLRFQHVAGQLTSPHSLAAGAARYCQGAHGAQRALPWNSSPSRWEVGWKMAKQKRVRRQAEGRVLKASNIKTRIVAVEQRIPHALYGRIIRRTAKFVAHDEREESQVGDLVRIEECRPMSKTKRWRLVDVLERQ